MGFKCPICFKDFGTDKAAWDDHIRKKHQGLGKDIEKVIREIVENTRHTNRDQVKEE